MKEILVIAPTSDIYDKALALVQEHGFDDVDVILANMAEGVQAAQQACREGTSILVSRGGTYEMLSESLEVPIVEIKVTAYDLVKSIKPLLGSEGPIGVMGYKNVVYGFDILADLLPVEIVKFEISSVDDVPQVIEEYGKRNIKVFVGDSNIEMVGHALQCEAVRISSRKTPIREAIEESRRILHSIKAQKRRSQQIIAVADFIHDGVIAIDEKSAIFIFNHSAEKIFGVHKEDMLGRDICSVLPECTLQEHLHAAPSQVGKVLSVRGDTIAINRTAVLVDGHVAGAVATFQPVSALQSVEQKIRRTLADKGFSARYRFEDIVHSSDGMAQCIAKGRKFAQYDTPVLVLGESGVGKELFCQSIHNSSARRSAPFVAINCAAIPASLIEAELFGYEQGAFTGAASKGRAGIFELAHRGTVFLDEIGELPLHLQGRLLRVLAEKTIMRVGGDKMIPVDVRIICATNKDLHSMVQEGSFRRDLFYRINVLTLPVPSLNTCGEQHILTLARHFLLRYSKRYGKAPLPLTPEVERALAHRRYEGNARELKGLMERCAILGSFEGVEEDGNQADNIPAGQNNIWNELTDLRSVEDRYIQHVYESTEGNCVKTCQILKISRTTLWRRLGMSKEDVSK